MGQPPCASLPTHCRLEPLPDYQPLRLIWKSPGSITNPSISQDVRSQPQEGGQRSLPKKEVTSKETSRASIRATPRGALSGGDTGYLQSMRTGLATDHP